MKFIGPLRRLKRALGVNEDEVVDGVGGEVEEHLSEFGEGVIEYGGAVGLIAGKFERRLKPGTDTWRMGAVGDGEVVAVTNDGNAGGMFVAKGKEIVVGGAYQVEHAGKARGVEASIVVEIDTELSSGNVVAAAGKKDGVGSGVVGPICFVADGLNEPLLERQRHFFRGGVAVVRQIEDERMGGAHRLELGDDVGRRKAEIVAVEGVIEPGVAVGEEDERGQSA